MLSLARSLWVGADRGMEPIMTTEGGFIEGLSRAYGAPLVRYLTEMLGSPKRAHEVAQASFEKVGRFYRPEQIVFPRALLFRVATNLALVELRRGRVQRQALVEAADIESPDQLPDHHVPVLSRQVNADQIGSYLAAAIKGLRPSLRQVFVMAHVQGKSRNEVATALGLSERCVDKRMTKALRACRERLASRGIDLAELDSHRSPIELVGERTVDAP